MSLFQTNTDLKIKLRTETRKKLPSSWEFHKFFRLYTHAIKRKELFFVCTFLTPNILDLVKCLEKHSRIAGYHILKNENQVKIFLNYDLTKNEPLVQKIVLFSSRGRKRIATQPMLNLFHYHYPNSLGIIGTRSGIMSSKECQAKNQGGEFIVSIT